MGDNTKYLDEAVKFLDNCPNRFPELNNPEDLKMIKYIRRRLLAEEEKTVCHISESETKKDINDILKPVSHEFRTSANVFHVSLDKPSTELLKTTQEEDHIIEEISKRVL